MNTTSVCQIEPAYVPLAGRPAYVPLAGRPAYVPLAGRPAYVPLAGRQSRDLNINIKYST
ncbi:hypothetical protein [Aequorivita viscosa]|uniref:Uncharacterized protein n=1 Tax=Aequorivita viscosa TaxID=797419 RepID=A0A1M6J1X0_9FLAO|nr:hypothetical protein [Aequorivita viscosa]SDX08029.1 hypothetical protein SAMN05216556_11658 [Aequorivita viscosa]SHJ40685.1 hypothetical protein SAMN04487908_1168 [Aequorivita viscosa]